MAGNKGLKRALIGVGSFALIFPLILYFWGFSEEEKNQQLVTFTYEKTEFLEKNLENEIETKNLYVKVNITLSDSKVTYEIITINFSSISIDYIKSLPLIRDPKNQLENTVNCKPAAFGYTQEQAKKYFKETSFRKCEKFGNDEEKYLEFTNDTLILHCKEGESTQYALGTYPDEEVFGDVKMLPIWRVFQREVKIGNMEFAFGKCSTTNIMAKLQNKFNQKASERALQRMEEIKQSLKINKIKPLTVIILLLDSVSRYHFYRNLNQTVDFFNSNIVTGEFSKKLAIYDFLINNAQGDTTRPNMIPLLYGYELSELEEKLSNYTIHNPSNWFKFKQAQNDAIWNHYKDLGFVTMFGYDTVNDFLSLCTGRKISTDHVVSNFYHGASKVFNYQDFATKERCIGNKNAHKYLLDYAYEFVQNYSGHNRFAYLHISPGHEETGRVIITADQDIKEFFNEILAYFSKNNEDFVIHFMSDHGKHSGFWDLDYEGYMENRLPMHFMITNKELISKIGKNTDEIIKYNTKRLVSRYDWHLTFKHLAILPYGNLFLDSETYKHWKSFQHTHNAVSLLLEKINDNRNCADLEIPDISCTCKEFKEISIEIAKQTAAIQKLIDLGISALNEKIRDKSNEDDCEEITFKEIVKAEVSALKPIVEGGNKKYKITVSINEGGKIEFNGYLVTDQFKKRFMVSNWNHLLPYLWFDKDYNGTTHSMFLQLREIKRVDDSTCNKLDSDMIIDANNCYCFKSN
ncbi:unnamed protein product [Blepharisma stoltei]|uniref:Uncharacterized protein n=1 Tax=Blepharisma stoltei TaxID=1481888 RepID=A0AAU9JKM4_9CILI|nr:unnamed protein product [Blepharisma stoltei]